MFTFDNLPPLDDVSPLGQRIVADLATQWRNDPEPTKPRAVGHKLLHAGPLFGRRDKGASSRKYRRSRFFHSWRRAPPHDGVNLPLPDPSGDREPSRRPSRQGAFKPAKRAPRARTQAELDALARANERRSAEARERKAAKDTSQVSQPP
jgi:hypothetical protein